MKRRDFVTANIAGGLVGISTIMQTFAQPNTDTPRAITNKTKKGPLKPFYIKPDEEPIQRGVTKVRFDQTNNQFSSMENAVPPKTMGPAPHLHKDLDEVMRVLKGTVTVMVGDELFHVEEGGWHLRPRGIVHTFWNAGDEPAVYIDFFPNQNFEIFLEEYRKLRAQFKKEGISEDSIEAIRRTDKLDKEWGIITYHDQRKPIMEKYGLK